MYKVIKFFHDLQDKNHEYNVGDIYPREGLKPTPERIAELSGSENKQKTPLIEVVEEKTDIEKMKVAELQAYAKEKGTDLDGATAKADILAKIKEAEAEK